MALNEAPAKPEPLEWTVDLGAGKGSKKVVVAAAALAAASFGVFVMGEPWLGIFALAAIFGSTLEIFVPQRYRLDESGARVRNGPSVTEIEWARVKRIEQCEEGVRLSPFEKPSRLDAFRGVFLRFDGNRDQVLAKMRELWDGTNE